MMTYELARQAIYTRLNDAWTVDYPSVPIQWENRLRVDLFQQTAPFIGCEVLFDGAQQASIEYAPIHRYTGSIFLTVFVKEHEGSAVQNTYLTYLTDLFKSTTFGSVNTKAAVPLPPALFEGWWRKSVAVGFWFDDIP